MKIETFHSKILNKHLDYYLLHDAEPEADAFVLYVQDGKDYLELGEIEKSYHKLLEAFPDSARKLIMVFIHPGDSLERWHSYHHKGDLFEKYIQFMNKEFIPAIEDRLPVKIRKRGLLGDSLAANISLNIASRNSSQWSHLLLQSAAVAPVDIFNIRRMTEDLSWQVHQSVGLREDDFISAITNEKLYILTRNRELHETLTEKGAAVHYTEHDEKHEWVFWKRELYETLRFFICR